ncbi:MAG: methylenetetrahydrofolate reductase [Marmoricola sp.]
MGHTAEEIGAILNDLEAAGVQNVLALRGDPAAGPGAEWVSTSGGFDHTDELIAYIRETSQLSIGVAAFPEAHPADSLERDTEVLKTKRDAGAEFAITDMVLRASDYFDLVARARAMGVDIPIIPGIMPILNYQAMSKMVELSGREMPQEGAGPYRALRDDPAALRAGGS